MSRSSSARLAEVEAELGRLKIELTESETRATSAREAAFARELEINRRQQQIALDAAQIEALNERSAAITAERASLEARREPARTAAVARREAAVAAVAERDRAAESLAAESHASGAALREIEGFEADVEAARSEVFSAINSATALRHSLEHADSGSRSRRRNALAVSWSKRTSFGFSASGRPPIASAATDGLRRAQLGARRDPYRAECPRVGTGQRPDRARMAIPLGSFR